MRGFGFMAVATAWCLGAACGGDAADATQDAGTDLSSGDVAEEPTDGVATDTESGDGLPADVGPDADPGEVTSDVTPVDTSDDSTPVDSLDDATPVDTSEDVTPVDTSDDATAVDTSDDTTPPDPCDGIGCGAHGTCVADPVARCECDEGFHADGLDCVRDLTPARFSNLPAAVETDVLSRGTFDTTLETLDGVGPYVLSVDDDGCGIGAAIDGAGRISWLCPSTSRTCAVSVVVTQEGLESDREVLTVTCLASPPVLVSDAPATASEHVVYSWTPACTDPNGLAVTLSVGPDDTCGGALASGAYAFTPGEDDGGSSCAVSVACGNGELTATVTRLVAIAEVNAAPVFSNLPSSVSAKWGRGATFTAIATDGDRPAQPLTYSVDGTTCTFPIAIAPTSGVASFTCAERVESCAATIAVSDGVASATGSLGITCTNTLPVASNVALTPSPAYRNSRLECAYAFADADGDEDESRIAWTRDGQGGVLGTGPFLEGGFSAGDVVRCTVTPNDGLADGTPVSASVTIQNRAPSASGLSVTPTTAYRNTPLLCSYTFSDPDGDEDTSRIAWTLDGEPGVLGTGAQLLTGYAAGDVVRCTVTPNDGIVDGAAVSATVTIGNRAPGVSEVRISPAAPMNEGEPLTCAYTFSDPDGDEDASSVEWLIEGVPLATGAVFDGHLAGDRVRCRVTADDGVELGNVADSAELVSPGPVARGAVGIRHACAIDDGVLSCWGNNANGQLGDNSGTSRHTPKVVSGFETGTDAVAVGHFHTCALKGGVVSCWGANTYGQVGVSPSSSEPKPSEISLPAAATAITAGANHACAIAGGAVYCWGSNIRGQLGTGDKQDTHVPALATGLVGDVQAVSAGVLHTCALVDGAAVCWGANAEGQTGTDSFNIEVLVPTAVAGLGAGVTAIESGANHSCAIADGALFCWGSNGGGRLGDGSQVSRFSPVAVVGMDRGVTHVGAGTSTCATRDRQLFCWGANDKGQVGAGVTSVRALTPTPVTGFEAGTARVFAGAGTACAVLDGELFWWGDNSHGQLQRHPGPELVPAPFDGGLTFTAISAGASHACGTATAAGTLYCWGSNQFGQLGIPGTLSHSVPTIVPGFESGVSHVAAGDLHTCVVRDGAAYCWGSNQFGQLGDGTTDARSAPTLVTGLNEGVTRVAATSASSCAVKDGAVFCWGSNVVGQLGDGTLIAKLEPVAALDLVENVTEIHGGRSHVCASQGGPLFCWGFNGKGQLGDGTTSNRSRPTAVLNMPAGVSIFGLGHQHTCAIRAGSVFCWGDNQYGQLGDGTAIAKSEPQQVPTQSSLMVALGVGGDHTCATKNRDLSCWGRNDKGQNGDGTTQTRVSPVLILDETGGRHIWLGDDFTCARQIQVSPTRDLCWGENAASQLGRVGPFSEFPL